MIYLIMYLDKIFSYLNVRGRGLEPPCPKGRYHLKVVRLPISPPALIMNRLIITKKTYIFNERRPFGLLYFLTSVFVSVLLSVLASADFVSDATGSSSYLAFMIRLI